MLDFREGELILDISMLELSEYLPIALNYFLNFVFPCGKNTKSFTKSDKIIRYELVEFETFYGGDLGYYTYFYINLYFYFYYKKGCYFSLVITYCVGLNIGITTHLHLF